MSTLIALLKLLPVLISVVREIEAAIPLSGQGKAKLDLILQTVSDVYGTVGDVRRELDETQLRSLIAGLVSRIVAVFNALGIFRTETA